VEVLKIDKYGESHYVVYFDNGYSSDVQVGGKSDSNVSYFIIRGPHMTSIGVGVAKNSLMSVIDASIKEIEKILDENTKN